MKIKIEHIPNTYNYGSLMMAVNTLTKIKSDIEKVELYVDTETEKDFLRLKAELGINDIYKIYSMKEFDKFNKIIKKIKIMKRERELYDLKIILGGDDISEYYGKKQWLWKFPLMYIESKQLPTILLGQTIGPFTGVNRILAKFALNKTKVYTRDDKCLKYLERLGIKTVKKGRDLAFLSLPMQKNVIDMLKKYNIEKNKYITVVPSGLTKSYTDDIDSYIKEQVKIIRNIINNNKLHDIKVLLLPHVLLPEYVDDRNVIREIMCELEDKLKEKVIAIEDEMLPSEAREILGNGLFTLTGRMHAAVSTFYMRKPAISLSYSVKYSGVIGDGLDMNDLVIESANKDLWLNGEISKLVEEKIIYVLENYDELVKKIDVKVNETSKITENQLNDLINEIKSIN